MEFGKDGWLGWLGWLLSALLGAGGLWSHLTARAQLQRSAPAAQTTADASFVEALGKFTAQFGEGAGALIGHLNGELTTVRGEVHELRGKVDACEERHADCEASLEREREERLALAAQIDRLMAGEVPGYEPRAPRHD